MFSKMYSLDKEEIGLNNKSLPFQNCHPSNPPQYYVKLEEKTTPKSKERKVSRGNSEWIRHKKWETKHQGLKKFMKNQATNKVKAP